MFQADLFADLHSSRRLGGGARAAASVAQPDAPTALDLPEVLARLATVSERPRHTFMVLNLIAKVADKSGKAGPFVRTAAGAVLIREWLCDALTPMAQRDPRRIARAASVRAELEAAGALPKEPEAANLVIDDEVRARVRRTGLTHVSRAVSDLVSAGLIKRHYEGYRVDHRNRGAQRNAVYTLLPPTCRAFATASGL